MTDAKALQWCIPPGAVRLYHLLREQGDTPYEAVGNVFVALGVIFRNQESAQAKRQRNQRKRGTPE